VEASPVEPFRFTKSYRVTKLLPHSLVKRRWTERSGAAETRSQARTRTEGWKGRGGLEGQSGAEGQTVGGEGQTVGGAAAQPMRSARRTRAVRGAAQAHAPSPVCAHAHAQLRKRTFAQTSLE